MDVSEFLRLALDPVRLSLLGRAAEGTMDVGAVAKSYGITEHDVRVALGKLRASGAVDADGRLDVVALRQLAGSLPQTPEADPDLLGEGWTEEEARVLSRFFSGSRLASIPSARTKRLVVLERLAQEFEPGLRYQEAEVNFALQMFHPDYAALRRYLVDESFLTRADGVYWRTGGRYDPPAADAAPGPG